MTYTHAALLLVALALAGCANEAVWTRNGADAGAARRDLAGCQQAAATAARQRFRIDTEIDRDRSAATGNTQLGNIEPTPTERLRLSDDNRRFRDSAVATCMTEKGYARK